MINEKDSKQKKDDAQTTLHNEIRKNEGVLPMLDWSKYPFWFQRRSSHRLAPSQSNHD